MDAVFSSPSRASGLVRTGSNVLLVSAHRLGMMNRDEARNFAFPVLGTGGMFKMERSRSPCWGPTKFVLALKPSGSGTLGSEEPSDCHVSSRLGLMEGSCRMLASLAGDEECKLVRRQAVARLAVILAASLSAILVANSTLRAN